MQAMLSLIILVIFIFFIIHQRSVFLHNMAQFMNNQHSLLIFIKPNWTIMDFSLLKAHSNFHLNMFEHQNLRGFLHARIEAQDAEKIFDIVKSIKRAYKGLRIGGIHKQSKIVVRGLGKNTYYEINVLLISLFFKKQIALHVLDISQLKMFEKMKHQELLRSDFYSNLSHELRTPLNIILNSIQLLNSKIVTERLNPDIDKVKKYVALTRQNCYRILRLINNIIDSSKMDAGYLHLNFVNVNIEKVVEDIVMSVAAFVESKGIQLEFFTEVEEKIIHCDLDALERIMLNILSNAIKFSRQGGKIYVKMTDLEEKLRITVEDEGLGIPSNRLEQIFERYKQASTRSDGITGSGIGLSIVKSLVELHGGELSVQSQIGVGSKFHIDFPKTKCKEELVSKVDYSSDQSRIERIHIEFADIYNQKISGF